MSKTLAQRRGRWAEDLACQYLRRQGLEVVARNYRGARGEIDLVMRLRDTVIFVEVRYRERDDYGTGAETVNRTKRGKLLATARQYLQRHDPSGSHPCRFDVISITRRDDAPRIEWIQNAFET
ncbi:MAG: YraN family protein [Gammaproteobacteria bacterium]|nr:YraN family protein [Gammaproteobacteria bacterium]NIR82275.1 YraN family protein [Gammaproteobacteria bacterium]NIR91206.1 YraN family protein [Gammaproteobacteria bacterium]NIU03424.1 YraN family protein [Gammaproteobacteria bacterium]NIX84699.1 YraN family protein [Gammaproteobacteria bacterium]